MFCFGCCCGVCLPSERQYDMPEDLFGDIDYDDKEPIITQPTSDYKSSSNIDHDDVEKPIVVQPTSDQVDRDDKKPIVVQPTSDQADNEDDKKPIVVQPTSDQPSSKVDDAEKEVKEPITTQPTPIVDATTTNDTV